MRGRRLVWGGFSPLSVHVCVPLSIHLLRERVAAERYVWFFRKPMWLPTLHSHLSFWKLHCAGEVNQAETDKRFFPPDGKIVGRRPLRSAKTTTPMPALDETTTTAYAPNYTMDVNDPAGSPTSTSPTSTIPESKGRNGKIAFQKLGSAPIGVTLGDSRTRGGKQAGNRTLVTEPPP